MNWKNVWEWANFIFQVLFILGIVGAALFGIYLELTHPH